MGKRTQAEIYNSNDNSNSEINAIPFIGPKAIFDPNFIPPVYIPREKVAHQLEGIILDAMDDGYTTNVNLYGLKGVGKNLMINHFIENLALEKNILSATVPLENGTKNPPTSADDLEEQVLFMRVDCSQNNIDQTYLSIIDRLIQNLNISLDLAELIQQSTAKLWHVVKVLVRKVKYPVLLYLQNSEHLGRDYLTTFYAFSKQTRNLQLLTGINSGVQRYSFKHYADMDHRIQMDTYTLSELHRITDDRSKMAFKESISVEAVHMVVDYIQEFDLKVPGACINYLQEVYPIIQNNRELHAEDMRNISQFYFDGFSLDAFSMADYVVNTNIEDRLFLEYIVNYFQSHDRFYIPFNEIKQAYQMTCEELGFSPKNREFKVSLDKILDAQIIRPSKTYQSESAVPHFLTLPLGEVSEIMNMSFGLDF